MHVALTQHLVRRSARPLAKKNPRVYCGPQQVGTKQSRSTRFSWSAGRHRTAQRGWTAPSEVREQERKMQIAQDNATAGRAPGAELPVEAGAARSPYSEYKVIRRNGAVVGFEPAKISVAV